MRKALLLLQFFKVLRLFSTYLIIYLFIYLLFSHNKDYTSITLYKDVARGPQKNQKLLFWKRVWKKSWIFGSVAGFAKTYRKLKLICCYLTSGQNVGLWVWQALKPRNKPRKRTRKVETVRWKRLLSKFFDCLLWRNLIGRKDFFGETFSKILHVYTVIDHRNDAKCLQLRGNMSRR